MEEQKKDEKINELEELRKKSEEYLAGWKRERADFINYKKDEAEKMGQLVKYANEEIILKILPILDNLRLAASHIKDPGVEQIKKQLEDFLAKEGIAPIETVGKKFDPATMESVGEAENGGLPMSAETGAVAEEVQKGYTMNGRVIRVAKVKIAK